eukprot:68885_1
MKPIVDWSMYKPHFHFIPFDDCWINDPVSPLVTKNGYYHLYVQYANNEENKCICDANDLDCLWQTKHWRHIVSKDLINWKEFTKNALSPTKGSYDNSGVWSGSSIVHNIDNEEILQIFWTSVFKSPPAHMNPVDWNQTQCTAFSKYPYNNFNKYKLNPIINLPPYGINNTSGFRDPFVFINPFDNQYYMVIGCGKKGLYGTIPLYKHIQSNNSDVQMTTNPFLLNWQYLGDIFTLKPYIKKY